MTTMTGMTMTMKTDPKWADAQKHEAEFWGNCLNLHTWHEFVKQEMYGREMSLVADYGDGSGEFDVLGKSVLDIGGGPVSMTLRCYNASHLVVADPIKWPASVFRRYRGYGIQFVRVAGEDLPRSLGLFEEVWIYNVLQHVDDPMVVMSRAKEHLTDDGKLRIFEWINIPADDCHPHVLTPELLLKGLSDLRALKFNIPTLNEYWTPNAQAFVGVFSP